MSSESICYDTLLASSPVTAIVGAGADARVFPSEVPQDYDLPAIAIVRTETEHLTTIHSSVPIASRATLEVECMAATREAASSLMVLVQTALGAAGFLSVDRRDAYTPETDPAICSDILVVSHWQP